LDDHQWSFAAEPDLTLHPVLQMFPQWLHAPLFQQPGARFRNFIDTIVRHACKANPEMAATRGSVTPIAAVKAAGAIAGPTIGIAAVEAYAAS
jgi:hypothetical protein